jgi:preprotein translocase subunit YajC
MAPQGGENQANPTSFIVMVVLMIAVFYFFMIRPQLRRQKELTKFRESLAKGDKIVTTGGIYGKVLEIKETYILMEVDDNVKIRVDKAAVIKDMSDVQPRK